MAPIINFSLILYIRLACAQTNKWYLVRIWEKADQKNSEYRHFLRSGIQDNIHSNIESTKEIYIRSSI